ncbi:hypothetical protein B0H19DRAFT_1063267 [Mycena capillaripes]|nr:hypothetical protein B0H19DRAFT_1063267 [Mycena capillaripes]
MDNETRADAEELTRQLSPGAPVCSNAAAVNTSAGDMIMIGCSTTSNFHTAVPAVPSGRATERRARVRKVYSARFEGRKSTVALYREGAEEEWHQDILQYKFIRRVSDSVLTGPISYRFNNYWTSIKIPIFQRFISMPATSLRSQQAAESYVYSDLQRSLSPYECTFWIRGSTGRLCAELSPDNRGIYLYSSSGKRWDNSWGMAGPGIPFILWILICTNTLGSRSFRSKDALKSSITITMLGWGPYEKTATNWLGQANHIFSHLRIKSDFEDYVLVTDVTFELKISHATESVSTGFLFLCPKKDFQIGRSSFCWPECPAYWSLDASGLDRLSTKKATQLGFPSIQMKTLIEGDYWDASVSTGLSQFCRAKGLDLESPQVAKHLGRPYHQLTSERDALPFAHANSVDFDAEEYDWDAVHSDGEFGYTQNSAGEDYKYTLQVDEGDSSKQDDVSDTDDDSGYTQTSPSEGNGCVAAAEFISHESTGEEEGPADGRLGYPDGMPPISEIFKFVMNVQLALMMLLTWSRLKNGADKGGAEQECPQSRSDVDGEAGAILEDVPQIVLCLSRRHSYVDVINRTPEKPIAEGSETLQKIMVNGFEIQQSRDPGWLVHPLCPFDLSTLTDISIWCATSPGIIAMMHSARSSLHTLRIDTREVTSEFALAELLALRRLEVFSGFGGAAAAATLLASVSVGSTAQLLLEHLTIRIAFLGTLDDESFLRLDAAIARLRAPQLRHVHLLVSKTGIPWRGVSSARFFVMVQGLRALFPHSNARGCFALSCIDGTCMRSGNTLGERWKLGDKCEFSVLGFLIRIFNFYLKLFAPE